MGELTQDSDEDDEDGRDGVCACHDRVSIVKEICSGSMVIPEICGCQVRVVKVQSRQRGVRAGI